MYFLANNSGLEFLGKLTKLLVGKDFLGLLNHAVRSFEKAKGRSRGEGTVSQDIPIVFSR